MFLHVVHLLFFRCPSAIGGSVVPVYVNAINGMIRRWLSSHICKEIFVRFKPPLTNLYSATSIMLEPIVACVLASRLHVYPRHPFGRSLSISTISVAEVFEDFEFMTSATSGVATSEMTPDHRFDRSTVAPNSVKTFEIWSHWKWLQYNETAKSGANNV